MSESQLADDYLADLLEDEPAAPPRPEARPLCRSHADAVAAGVKAPVLVRLNLGGGSQPLLLRRLLASLRRGEGSACPATPADPRPGNDHDLDRWLAGTVRSKGLDARYWVDGTEAKELFSRAAPRPDDQVIQPELGLGLGLPLERRLPVGWFFFYSFSCLQDTDAVQIVWRLIDQGGNERDGAVGIPGLPAEFPGPVGKRDPAIREFLGIEARERERQGRVGRITALAGRITALADRVRGIGGNLPDDSATRVVRTTSAIEAALEKLEAMLDTPSE